VSDTTNAVSRNRCFGGMQGVYTHAAETTHCSMRFGVFMPPQAESARVPVLYWLSGLTCTEDNFIVKAGAQRVAAELGVAIVVPDTSPRGLGYPGEADAYDFGLGAGFYVDATEAPWSEGYRMYSYVTNELPAYVERHFAVVAGRAGIFGHSMGGHGALTIALKNPGRYRSVSAFAPIASPMRCPWGEKALTGYLGSDRSRWREYDATALIADRGLARTCAARRPGHERSVHRKPAQARAPAPGVRTGGRGARLAVARRLRPQLLFHRDVHRGAPALSRASPARVMAPTAA
jgi:S-formylglutathione hydrolase